MTLHPIRIVDQVLEEYEDYLLTEFRARDEGLRQALQEALQRPNFLAQEPFFQAHRPFKDGLPWRDLGLDSRLAEVMEKRSQSKRAYLHQSEAVIHLMGPASGPLVVTTGTGSGKTECFLLPVIQNAIDDSVRFRRPGLTAILLYPMNALANDQDERIRQYLADSGHTHVSVAKYDQSTPEEERERLRRQPPHLLLTNYVMLEYLMVRSKDRQALFANHRCRFLVLDEVHTYRGALGANIALLFRRLLTHLAHATQDWGAAERDDPYRFPKPVAVATSATIKSLDESGKTPEETRALRDAAVREFFATLTGTHDAIRVIGEEIRDLVRPPEARWSASPMALDGPDVRDLESVRDTLCALGGVPAGTPLPEAARRAAILWLLGDLLARRPLSVSGIVERIRADVPERRDADSSALRREVVAALVAGAAIPDDVPGGLRLRVHRLLRGGWRFHRCVDPACGRLFPMGEEACACGKRTAPLYICRSCGTDVLRFREGEGGPEKSPLIPHSGRESDGEWVVYDRTRHDLEDDEELQMEMKGRGTRLGSFDPNTLLFSADGTAYPLKVALAPARNRCLVCGFVAASGSVLTPVALGTSAAVRVLAEGVMEALADQHRGVAGHDGKERLLIFADSRQDAAHQARFISYAGRYDRMRRRLVEILEQKKAPLTIDQTVQALMVTGVEKRDNPHTAGETDAEFLNQVVQEKARAWEEAALLDDLAVSAGYRATAFNLGLVGVVYERLSEYCEKRGGELAGRLGVSVKQLEHIARTVLDEMRRRMALGRPMLRYHPLNPSFPDPYKSADWERRVEKPAGFACDASGAPVGHLDADQIPDDGLRPANFWRREGRGGARPILERRFRHLMQRVRGNEATETLFLDVVAFLVGGPGYIRPFELHGFRKSRQLLQVNPDTLRLVLVPPEDRRRCSVCSVRMPWAEEGAPCPNCDGDIIRWRPEDVEGSRYTQRIRKSGLLPLVAGEHTAQVTGDDRIDLETRFKAPPAVSPLNVLACSPTLEMGIDVGGLDAVIMRNVPPRPDNYAQRGGRAGRRSRVGIVLAYARSTPHDGYFYDKPTEMIAGEVPAPMIGLGNRDVLIRHLGAIALGRAEPGLAGRMAEYVSLQGELEKEGVEKLLEGIRKELPAAARVAREAWGADVLGACGLLEAGALEAALDELPTRIAAVFDRVRFQIKQLESPIDRWTELGMGGHAAIHAMELKKRLLGIVDAWGGTEADSRTSGFPMRRFAEFGLLPGYEFPSEPSSLRLYRDQNEASPLYVERRFGIAQYQPEATVHARGHRWRVRGLDPASPWNSKSEVADWVYLRCKPCDLRYGVQEHTKCPRCSSHDASKEMPGHEFGGFFASRDDTPVLEEEDRWAMASLVRCHPQWSGMPAARYQLSTGWIAEVRHQEDVRWVNESKPPTAEDFAKERPRLHEEARGFYLCPVCGRILSMPDTPIRTRGRRRANDGNGPDPFGHGTGCTRASQPPAPLALVAKSLSTTLRLRAPVPEDLDSGAYKEWGQSLGYALRAGLRHLYMLDGPEIEFELEPHWVIEEEGVRRRMGALTFIDPAVGGSGFLDRAAREFHLVAARAVEHLDHRDCDTACYRCLKSYTNQRVHDYLSWPRVIPDLQQLAERPPESLAWTAAERDAIGPWLEAYAAGVGSPLELSFLRLFEKHGIEVEKQVGVAPDEGGRAISIADFVVKGRKVAIYVDGAAFHQGERLRRDRFIRDRLRGGRAQWRIVELRAADLGHPDAVLERVRTPEV